MASEEHNALAKLAERLKGIHKIENCNGVPYEKMTFSIDDIEKASRIIEELAKVKDEDGYPMPYDYKRACRDAYENCRAIAVE